MPGDIAGEIDAIVEMVTNCDERVLLQCCCAPAKCHLDHIAGICNLKIAAVLEERMLKGKHARRAAPSDVEADSQSLRPAATVGSAKGAVVGTSAEGTEEASDTKGAADAPPTSTAANTEEKPCGADDGQIDEGARSGLHGKAREPMTVSWNSRRICMASVGTPISWSMKETSCLDRLGKKTE